MSPKPRAVLCGAMALLAGAWAGLNGGSPVVGAGCGLLAALGTLILTGDKR